MGADIQDVLSESLGVFILLAGLILIVVGIAIWSWPLALVAAGIELCVIALLYNRGGTEQQ